ncbi:MAG TPA: non-homologous end-joining DNA ligase [Gemmatimonadaceae bacterium]|jgi:bifunctional non-homologous end joining protein LigD
MTTAATIGRKLNEYRRKRDFEVTAEPRGGMTVPRLGRALAFVVQKHAASHLHYDVRLEMGGVMKSWAVPKGPSLDPSARRLAVQVEDHPMEYNSFEGIIPRGEYGGGTVMLWDRGSYESADLAEGDDPERALRRDLHRGRLSIRFFGQRMRGVFALVRTSNDDGDGKPQWLLIKRDDDAARSGSDITADAMTSVATGRSLEEIAADASRVWHSNRSAAPEGRARRTRKTIAAATAAASRERSAAGRPALIGRALTPMLATVADVMPNGEEWTFEPKYDGIRILAFVADGSVSLLSRNGNSKTAQFPEIVAALAGVSRARKKPFVLDGEIVALDGDTPARFQQLQSRMHATDRAAIAAHREDRPVAYVVFDVLLDGDEALIHEAQHVRRAHLLQLLIPPVPHVLRVSDSLEGNATTLLDEARDRGWEGVIAKRKDAMYEPGKRSRAWLKLKVEQRQEFVVGGYTEPRNSRQHIGAILLGYHDDAGNLVYAGHTGGGFSRQTLTEMYRRLAPLERKTSPFVKEPRTNERAHWVRPRVVVEVKFNEWTADRKLRQPIFVGVRDDKDPAEVRREPVSIAAKGSPKAKRTARRRRAAAG